MLSSGILGHCPHTHVERKAIKTRSRSCITRPWATQSMLTMPFSTVVILLIDTLTNTFCKPMGLLIYQKNLYIWLPRDQWTRQSDAAILPSLLWYHTFVKLNTQWPQRRGWAPSDTAGGVLPSLSHYENGFLIWYVYRLNGIKSMLNVFWCIIWVPAQAPHPDGASCCGERWYGGWDWAAEQTIRAAGNRKQCINPVSGQHFHTT